MTLMKSEGKYGERIGVDPSVETAKKRDSPPVVAPGQ
jgi:hypothetical protein